MIRRIMLAALSLLVAIPMACGAGNAGCANVGGTIPTPGGVAATARDPAQRLRLLAAGLPDLAPTTGEVQQAFGFPQVTVERFQARFCSDAQLQRFDVKKSSDFAGVLNEFPAASRVQGYAATYGYIKGFSLEIIIVLYADDDAAQRALMSKSPDESGSAVEVPLVGDASRAWAQGITGTKPACMCPFRFRVGSFVAETTDSYGVSRLSFAPDRPQLAIAAIIAGKMRAVLAE